MFEVPGVDRPDGPAPLRWPFGFSPDLSHLCAVGEVRIRAAPAAVFACLTEICAWARGFTARPFDTGGAPVSLRLGGEFTFRLDRLPVRAQVIECRPDACLAWSGHGIDLDVYQEWALTALRDGTRVRTGLAARGAAAISRREAAPEGAQRLVNQWLTGLRAVAERT